MFCTYMLVNFFASFKMTRPSSFQSLPLEVATKIAQLLFKDQYRTVLGDYFLVSSSENVCYSLYSVCRLWHYLVFEHCYESARLDFTSSKRKVPLFLNLPKNIKERTGQLPYNYTKCLEIKLPNNDGVFVNSFLAEIGMKWKGSLKFPNARTLIINTNCESLPTNRTYNRIGVKEIKLVAQRIVRALPDISTIKLGLCGHTIQVDSHFGSLDTGIHRLLQAILDDFDPGHIGSYPIEHIAKHSCFSLTTLNCSFSSCGPELPQLIHNSALTLTTLTIILDDGAELCTLVQTENGNAIEYPRLEYLKVVNYNAKPVVVPTNVRDSDEPFPVLKELSWCCSYRFSNDIMFRNTRQTLQHLHIAYKDMLCAFGAEYPAFRYGLFTKLRSVDIGERALYLDTVEFNNDLLVNTLFRIVSPVTHSIFFSAIGLRGDVLCRSIDKWLSVLDVRELTPLNAQFDLPDVIKITKLLPSLESLCFRINRPTDKQLILSDDGYVERQYITNKPLCNRLRQLQYQWTPNNLPEDYALVIMILTLICPNLICVSLPFEGNKAIHQHIVALLSTTPLRRFCKYLDHVSFK